MSGRHHTHLHLTLDGDDGNLARTSQDAVPGGLRRAGLRLNRRRALALLGFGGLVAAIARLPVFRPRLARFADTLTVWRRSGLPAEITPTDRFYQVSKNLIFNPSVDVDRWRLHVYGLVGRRLELTWADVTSLPAVEQYATLACISNEVPAIAISTALWKGVRLRDVLDRAGGVDRITH